MGLSYRQEYELRLIDAGLRRLAPHLGAMFGVSGRLHTREDMPAWEHVASKYLFQPTAWIAAVLQAVAAASRALVMVATVTVRRRAQAA